MMRQLVSCQNLHSCNTPEDETKEGHVTDQVTLPCTSDSVIRDSDPVVTKVVKANQRKKDKCRTSCQFNEDIKQQIADGPRLNDTVRNLALKALHIQFPLIPGLEDTDAGEKRVVHTSHR